MCDAAGSIYIAAAQRHDACRSTPEHRHELACLASRAEHHVDDDVRDEGATRRRVRRQLSAIAEHLGHPFGNRVAAAMKDDDLVAGGQKSANGMRTDETGRADEQYTHRSTLTPL